MFAAGPQAPLAFTPLEEVERAVQRAIDGWDLDALARRCVAEHLDRVRGRI